MSEYRKFDWKHCVETHTSETVNYYWNLHFMPLQEVEFVKGFIALPHDHPKRSRHHAPSYAKTQYRNLKNKFGFFTGEVDYRKAATPTTLPKNPKLDN